MAKDAPMQLLGKLEVARRLDARDLEGNISERWVNDTLYRDPTFPKPRKHGKFNKWLASEIDEYIANLPIGRARGGKGEQENTTKKRSTK